MPDQPNYQTAPKEQSNGCPAEPGYTNIPMQLVNERQLVYNDCTQYRNDTPLVQEYLQATASTARVAAYHKVDLGSGQGEVPSYGTGFVITLDGKLATDYHVVEGADKLQVNLNGKTYNATVAGTDKRTDLAIIQLDNPNNDFFSPLTLTHSTMKAGEEFNAFGYPKGVAQMYASPGAYQGRTTLGAFASHLDGGVMPGEDANRVFLQGRVRLDLGNSGGPVMNDRGEIVGVVDISNTYNAAEITPVEDLLSLLSSIQSGSQLRSASTLMLGNQPFIRPQSQPHPGAGQFPGSRSSAIGSSFSGWNQLLHNQ